MEHYEDLLLAFKRSREYVEPGVCKLRGVRGDAERLLMEGNSAPIVAAAVGYASVVSFSRAWVRVYGVSPREWAKARGVRLSRTRRGGNRILIPRKTWRKGERVRPKPKVCKPAPEAPHEDVI